MSLKRNLIIKYYVEEVVYFNVFQQQKKILVVATNIPH